MRPFQRVCAVALGALLGSAALAQELPDLGTAKPRADDKRDEKRESNKSYCIPAAEIVGFEFLLNRIDRRIYGADYEVSTDSIRKNLHGPWVVDNDPFKVNQLGHPYQGSIYHNLARSSGLGCWESFGYTFAGSALWEYAGETTPPSKNDQVASGIAGSFLGESLFRMSHLVLEHGGAVKPSLWRELSAAVISPANGFNRLAFHERFSDVLNSREPEYYSRVQVGAAGSMLRQEGNAGQDVKRNEVLLDYSMDYGLPGKRGYHYERPWDYFSFQITASTANGVENLSTRGLLIGKEYERGERYRGVWGLYGSYDYIVPQVFRISSTALSLGTTGQLHISEAIDLQGTVTGGVGYAGVGTVGGTTDTDFHYGATPQALVALRAIFQRASLDFTGREYFVSNVAGAGSGGRDNIARADIAFTVRVRGEHGVAIKYLWSQRQSTVPGMTELTQTRATLGIFYVYLGRQRFGAVDWNGG